MSASTATLDLDEIMDNAKLGRVQRYWCSVFGRLGAITGPVVAGYLVGAELDWAVFFVLLGVVPLLSVLGTFRIQFGQPQTNTPS